jgi:hypothetical protein
VAIINSLRYMGDAVRERAGLTEPMTIEQMADAVRAIPQPVVESIEITRNGTYTPPTGVDGFDSVEVEVQGTVDVEPIVLTGNQNNGCSSAIAREYIKLFGDTVSTNRITSATYMFSNYDAEIIPFELNFAGDVSSCTLDGIFTSSAFSTPPKMNNCYPSHLGNMFTQCHYLTHIPDDFFDGFNFKYINNASSAYSGSMAGLFSYCYSLRSLPIEVYRNYNPKASYSYLPYYNAFRHCTCVDEIVGLKVMVTASPVTSDMLYNTFTDCYRLKRIVFETNDDGSPIVVQWKSQTINLSSGVGFSYHEPYITDYASGITADKKVKDDATYAALKNDPDWYTTNNLYSRYDKVSAIETINSLPDTSAYLATAGGTNTIRFNGLSGKNTDGGAINTLTEAEIAVATAKGWTVAYY